MATVKSQRKPVRRQLINVVHNNRAMYDPAWFKRGQAILLVERVFFEDGSSEKRLVRFQDPTVRYYVTEGANSLKLPALAVEIAKCSEYESKYDAIDKDVANLTGQMDYYRETAGPGSRKRRRKLHDHRDLHGSDVNLADHYIDRYMEHFKETLDTTTPLQHAYADIEVDIIDHVGFPEEWQAPCPTILVSYFHEPTKTLYQYHSMTHVRDNPQRDEFAARHEEMAAWMLVEVNRAPLEKPRVYREGKEEFKIPPLIGPEAPWEEVRDALATEEGRLRQRCDHVKLVFCDDERGIYEEYFTQLNERDRPDILAYWNMKFDALTMINRMKKHLDIDPAQYFCPQDFREWELVDYSVDEFNVKETERGDTMTVAGWTMYVDQMLLYASLRKQAGQKEKYTLDFTLSEEIKENKLHYEGNIRDFAYRDYQRYSLYGALDVIPMATLESKTEDFALNYQVSMLTRTRFSKTMKKTTCLRNFANVFYRERGLTLSNNHNKNRERTAGQKFRGALVSHPDKMEAVGIEVGGEPSNRVFEDTVDFDASSLYPSIIIAFLIDAMAQYGRIVFVGSDGEMQDASQFIEDFTGRDAVSLGKQYFGMPGLTELEQIVVHGKSMELA